MGKAAKRAKAKSCKHLKSLSEKNSPKFEIEFSKVITSWSMEITRDAGKFLDLNGRQRPPAFDFVDEAMRILEQCGKQTFEKYAKKTWDILVDALVSSWLVEITKDAGKLSDHKGRQRPPVFDLLDKAMRILDECCKQTFEKYAKGFRDIRVDDCFSSFSLVDECCSSFSKKSGIPYLYRMSNTASLEFNSSYCLKGVHASGRNNEAKQSVSN